MKDFEKFKKFNKFLAALIILSVLTLSFSYVWLKYYNFYRDSRPIVEEIFDNRGNWLLVVVYFVILFIFSRIYGSLRVGYLKKFNIIYSQLLTILCVNTFIFLIMCLIARGFYDLMPMLLLTIFDLGVIIIWAYISDFVFSKLYPPKNMVIVYGSKLATELVYKMSSRDDKYRITYSISIDSDIEEIKQLISKFDAVIICDVPSQIRNVILKYCYEKSIRAYVTPKISDIIIRSAEEINLFDTPLILCRNHGLTFEQRFLKRLLDLVLSSIALILFSPFMLIIAIAIKATDGGPVLFRQERCTLNGKSFLICKFRSMIVDAEKDGKSIPAIDNDPRITRVGKIIRKLRLDEIPQLFNIFVGDMSIVGPRPERIEHIEEFIKEIPEFNFRLKVKGGLTGYAQIIGKYNTSAYDKLRLDMMYIQNYSFILDIKLILMTIKILFMKESTEGFKERKSDK